MHRRGGSGQPVRADEEGSLTAEFALLMPVVVVMIAVLLGAGAAGSARLETIEAARLAAREHARGTDPARVEALVRSSSARASYSARREGDLVRVRAAISLPGAGLIPGLEIESEAVARVEQETPDAPGEDHGP